MNMIDNFLLILLLSYSATAIMLEFPLDCNLGENCRISKLPRHYLKGKQVDFHCGRNTYNGHKGTDFALKNYNQMYKGVKVLAPFDGEIVAVRDRMKDVNVRIAGRKSVKGVECGNGVVVANGEYEAQLCHLKKGSILVRTGQTIKKGYAVGLVGLSGFTDFPHLHISLRKNTNEIDPFYGDQEGCGRTPKSMWKDMIKMHRYSQVISFSIFD